MIIKMQHIRQANMCSSGARKFFDRHGLDWADFLKNGIDEQPLLDTQDAMAARVVKVAHERG